MDMLDEIADELKIDSDTLIELRRRYGGETHYIESARRLIQEKIRQSDLPAAIIARKYSLHRKTVQRIQQKRMI